MPAHGDDVRFIQAISYNEARQFPSPRALTDITDAPPLNKEASGYQLFAVTSRSDEAD